MEEIRALAATVPPEDVQLFHVDNALAIKVSIPRPVFSGDLDDSDVFGGQQYAPLVDLEVPDNPAIGSRHPAG